MLNLIKKLKPNLGKYSPEKVIDLLSDEEAGREILFANQPQYLYFDEIKNLPEDFEKEKFWALVKLQRKFSSRPIPPANFNERNFLLCNLFQHNEFLYKLDNGSLLNTSSLSTKKKDELLNNALVEEAIYSASIENNDVKFAAARKVIFESTQPKNEAESFARETYLYLQNFLKLENLTASDISDNAERNEEAQMVYAPHDKSKLCYIAPSQQIFERELQRLLTFANDEAGTEFFHPLVKAAILHFWILILNPRQNDSGITARAIYYWYLNKRGYQQLMLLPLSRFIKNDLPAYTNAISCTAQDDNDFTYFLDFMIRMTGLGIDSFNSTTIKNIEFDRSILPRMQQTSGLNERQVKLVYELMQFRAARTNFSAYMKDNAITRRTAALDLKKLESEGYLKSQKLGKNVFYYAADKAGALFK